MLICVGVFSLNRFVKMIDIIFFIKQGNIRAGRFPILIYYILFPANIIHMSISPPPPPREKSLGLMVKIENCLDEHRDPLLTSYPPSIF